MTSIETPFPKIKFFIKTVKDYTTDKNNYIDYNKQTNIDNIYFLTNEMDLSANRELLTKFSIEKEYTTNISHMFTSQKYLKDLLKYSSGKFIKKYEILEKDGSKPQPPISILESNINFLKDLFFKQGSHFYINNKKYIIDTSTILINNVVFKTNMNNKYFYTVDNYITQQDTKGTYKYDVYKLTTYIVFVELKLIDYRVNEFKNRIELRKNNEQIFKNKYLNEIPFKNMNCNDKKLFLEAQADELGLVSFDLYNANDTPVKNETDSDNTKVVNKFIIPIQQIIKQYPIKTLRQLEDEKNIAIKTANDNNEKNENEILKRVYLNRKKSEQEKKRKEEEKKRKAEYAIKQQQEKERIERMEKIEKLQQEERILNLEKNIKERRRVGGNKRKLKTNRRLHSHQLKKRHYYTRRRKH